MTHVLESPFMLGERVCVDGGDVVATITFVMYNGCWSYEVSWMHNGDYKIANIAAWRLAIVPGEEPESDYPKLNVSGA